MQYYHVNLCPNFSPIILNVPSTVPAGFREKIFKFIPKEASAHIFLIIPKYLKWSIHMNLIQLEGTAPYASLLLAIAEGFGFGGIRVQLEKCGPASLFEDLPYQCLDIVKISLFQAKVN